MFYPVFVHLSVCKQPHVKTTKHFTIDASVIWEEMIKFLKSASGSRNSLKDSSILQDRAFFHNLFHISKNSIRSSQKF